MELGTLTKKSWPNVPSSPRVTVQPSPIQIGCIPNKPLSRRTMNWLSALTCGAKSRNRTVRIRKRRFISPPATANRDVCCETELPKPLFSRDKEFKENSHTPQLRPLRKIVLGELREFRHSAVAQGHHIRVRKFRKNIPANRNFFWKRIYLSREDLADEHKRRP